MTKENITPTTIIKAASACVWRGDEVLLVKRGKAWGHGTWSLPGGKLEPGETDMEAASRELFEETGVTADLEFHVGDFDLRGPVVHYVIACCTGLYRGGEAVAATDAKAVQWLDYRALSSMPLAFNTAAAIRLAHDLIRL